MNIIDFFPYPFLLGLLVLAWPLARNRKRGWLYLAALGLFGIYLLVVIDIIAFPIRFTQQWPAFQSWKELALSLTGMVNLIPGNYGNMFSDLAMDRIQPGIVYMEIFGNIMLTVPFGLGIRLFYPVQPKRFLWLALAVGLTLEVTQLLINVCIGPNLHSVDINDVLLNALGVLIGLGLYRVVEWGWQLAKRNFLQTSS